MKKSLVFPLLLIAACLIACTRNGEQKHHVAIALSPDSAAIVVNGIPAGLIEVLSTDSLPEEDWQSVLLVCKESADETLQGMEPACPGKYAVRDSSLIFRPDSGFVTNQTYRAEYRVPGFYSRESMPFGKKLPGSTQVVTGRFKF